MDWKIDSWGAREHSQSVRNTWNIAVSDVWILRITVLKFNFGKEEASLAAVTDLSKQKCDLEDSTLEIANRSLKSDKSTGERQKSSSSSSSSASIAPVEDDSFSSYFKTLAEAKKAEQGLAERRFSEELRKTNKEEEKADRLLAIRELEARVASNVIELKMAEFAARK